jgi:hypothetical protein
VSDHDQLLSNFLEADQVAAEAERPLPRAPLGRRAVVALWVLRVFVIVMSAMVIYVFVSQLSG